MNISKPNHITKIRALLIKYDDQHLSCSFISRTLNIKLKVVVQYMGYAFRLGWVSRISKNVDSWFGNPNIKTVNSIYKIVHTGDWAGLVGMSQSKKHNKDNDSDNINIEGIY